MHRPRGKKKKDKRKREIVVVSSDSDDSTHSKRSRTVDEFNVTGTTYLNSIPFKHTHEYKYMTEAERQFVIARTVQFDSRRTCESITTIGLKRALQISRQLLLHELKGTDEIAMRVEKDADLVCMVASIYGQ